MSMLRRPRNWIFLVSLAALPAAGVPAGAGDWTRFRGPNGAGVAADKEVPVKWGADNVLWKAPLPGVGHSSPIVCGGRVFVQSASADGKERWLIALDAASGRVLWKTPAPGHRARMHKFNSLASSTPATDGQRVYAVFWDGDAIHLGAYGIKDGKPVWEKDLGSFRSQHGFGHSPMLVGGKVILANDQDGSAELIALDARSGERAWQTPRRAFRSCYSTPIVRPRTGGGEELIVASTAGVTGYNPDDGKETWRYDWKFYGKPLRTVASPILAGGLVLASSGDGAGDRHLIAVKPGDRGDVTADHLAWEDHKKSASAYVPCLLARGDHVYGVTDKGAASCHEARTGKQVWREERLSTVGFTASPVLVDGKVYAVDQDGAVFVFEAAPRFRLLAKNEVGEPVSASSAVADNCLFVRGDRHLFCIGKKDSGRAGR